MADQAKTYNGWTNYETWAVALWLDNDQGTYNHWRGRAEELYRDAVREDPTEDRDWWTRQAASTLADELKSEIDDDAELPRKLDGTLYADLLGAALSEVNWYEIGSGYVEGLELDEIEAAEKPEAETEEPAGDAP